LPTFFFQRGRGCSSKLVFSIFDISIHSRDIRNQCLQLCEIAPNFARFLASQIVGVRAPEPVHANFYSCLTAHDVHRFGDAIHTGPKVISQNACTSLPIFKFSLLKNCWEIFVPDTMYICKPWEFYTTRTNLSGQRPFWAEVWPSQKVDFGCVNIKKLNLVVSGPKFSQFVRPIGIVVNHLLLPFSISQSVPEIFG